MHFVCDSFALIFVNPNQEQSKNKTACADNTIAHNLFVDDDDDDDDEKLD